MTCLNRRVQPLLVSISLSAALVACARSDYTLGRLASTDSDGGDSTAADLYVPPQPAPEAWITFLHGHGQLLGFATMNEWETAGPVTAVVLDGVDGSTFPRGSFGVRALGGSVQFTNIVAMPNLWFLSGLEGLRGDNVFSGPDLVSLDGLQDVASVSMGSDNAILNTAGRRIGGLRALENLGWIAWGADFQIVSAGGSTLRLTRLGAPPETLCDDLGRLGLFGHEIRTLELAGTGLFGSLYLRDGPLADLSGIAAGTELCELGLGGNQITDVRPLAAINLRGHLGLENNPLADIGPLASASYAGTLGSLGLASTQVSDLTPLASFARLLAVDISDTPVTDLGPLAGMTNLMTLGLGELSLDQAAIDVLATLPLLERIEGNLPWAGRGITDLSGLAGVLYFGARVDLSNNDLTTLAGLERVLGIGDLLDLRGNPQLTEVAGLAALHSQGGAGRLYLPENLTDVSGLSGFVGDAMAPDTIVLPTPNLIVVRAAATSPVCGALDAGTILLENGVKADLCAP